MKNGKRLKRIISIALLGNMIVSQSLQVFALDTKWTKWTIESEKQNEIAKSVLYSQYTLNGKSDGAGGTDSTSRVLNVVEFDQRSEDVGIAVVHNNDLVTGQDSVLDTATYAKEELGLNVVAAINGDFSQDITDGIPMGFSIVNGEVYSTDDVSGKPTIGIKEDGTAVGGNFDFRSYAIIEGFSNSRINRVNEDRGTWGDLVLYTSRMGIGYDTATTKSNAINVVLKSEQKPILGEVMELTVESINIGKSASIADENTYILSLEDGVDSVASAAKVEALSQLQVGESIQISMTTNDADSKWQGVKMAISGNATLVSGGKTHDDAWSKPEWNSLYTRSALGIKKDGTMIMVTADKNSESVGATLCDMTNMLKDSDVDYAINLCGGDASTMAIRPTGKVDLEVVSNGGNSITTNSFVVYSNTKQAELDSVVVNPNKLCILGGSTYSFEAYGIDINNNPVNINDILWSTNNNIGAIEDGVFTSNLIDDSGAVIASTNGKSGQAEVEVVSTLDSIKVEPLELNLESEGSHILNVIPQKDSKKIISNISDYDFEVSGGVGAINEETGEFIAATTSETIKGEITVTYNGVSTAIPVIVGNQDEDNKEPVIVDITPGNESLTGSPRQKIEFHAVDYGIGLDKESVKMTLDGQDVTPSYVSEGATYDSLKADVISFVPSEDLTAGEHKVTIEISDKNGNTKYKESSFFVTSYTPRLEFLLENGVFVSGQDFIARLRVNFSDDLGRIKLKFKFDPEKLYVNDVNYGKGLWQDCEVTKVIDNENGTIELEYTDLEWVFYGSIENLLTIEGIVKEDAKGTTSIELEDGTMYYVSSMNVARKVNVLPIEEKIESVISGPYKIVNPYGNVDWDEYEKVASVTHTHNSSSDGNVGTALLVKLYEALGYGILAITDHNVNANTIYSWDEYADVLSKNSAMLTQLERYFGFDNSEVRKEYLEEISNTMLSIEGTEISQAQHITSLFNDYADNTEKNNEAIVANIESNGGLSHYNHLERDVQGSPYYDLKADVLNSLNNYDSLVGVEAVNCGLIHDDNIPVWDYMLSNVRVGRTVVGFAEDDAHEYAQVGKDWNVYLLPEGYTEEDSKNAMKNGQMYMRTASVVDKERGKFTFTGYSKELENKIDSCIKELNGLTGEDKLNKENEIDSLFDQLIIAMNEGRNNVPDISNIVVDENASTILIEGTNYNKIVWISQGVEIAETAPGEVFNYNDYAMNKYVRAELRGENGTAYTQAFTIELDSSSTIEDEINNLPDEITADDINNVIAITKAVESLDGEISQEALDKLVIAQNKVAKINNNKGNISAEGLPWYVGLKAIQYDDSSDKWLEIKEDISDEELELLLLQGIYFNDLYNGGEYYNSNNSVVNITIDNVNLSEYKELNLVYYNQENTLVFIPIDNTDNKIKFKTNDAGEFGVTGTKKEDENGGSGGTEESNDIKDLIAEIEKLPENITLDQKELVNSLLAKYEALSQADKALVTNIDKLISAKNKIEELENKEEPKDPEEPENPDVEVSPEKPNDDNTNTSGDKDDNNSLPETGGTSTKILVVLGLVATIAGVVVFKRKDKIA